MPRVETITIFDENAMKELLGTDGYQYVAKQFSQTKYKNPNYDPWIHFSQIVYELLAEHQLKEIDVLNFFPGSIALFLAAMIYQTPKLSINDDMRQSARNLVHKGYIDDGAAEQVVLNEQVMIMHWFTFWLEYTGVVTDALVDDLISGELGEFKRVALGKADYNDVMKPNSLYAMVCKLDQEKTGGSRSSIAPINRLRQAMEELIIQAIKEGFVFPSGSTICLQAYLREDFELLKLCLQESVIGLQDFFAVNNKGESAIEKSWQLKDFPSFSKMLVSSRVDHLHQRSLIDTGFWKDFCSISLIIDKAWVEFMVACYVCRLEDKPYIELYIQVCRQIKLRIKQGNLGETQSWQRLILTLLCVRPKDLQLSSVWCQDCPDIKTVIDHQSVLSEAMSTNRLPQQLRGLSGQSYQLIDLPWVLVTKHWSSWGDVWIQALKQSHVTWSGPNLEGAESLNDALPRMVQTMINRAEVSVSPWGLLKSMGDDGVKLAISNLTQALSSDDFTALQLKQAVYADVTTRLTKGRRQMTESGQQQLDCLISALMAIKPEDKAEKMLIDRCYQVLIDLCDQEPNFARFHAKSLVEILACCASDRLDQLIRPCIVVMIKHKLDKYGQLNRLVKAWLADQTEAWSFSRVNTVSLKNSLSEMEEEQDQLRKVYEEQINDLESRLKEQAMVMTMSDEKIISLGRLVKNLGQKNRGHVQQIQEKERQVRKLQANCTKLETVIQSQTQKNQTVVGQSSVCHTVDANNALNPKSRQKTEKSERLSQQVNQSSLDLGFDRRCLVAELRQIEADVSKMSEQLANEYVHNDELMRTNVRLKKQVQKMNETIKDKDQVIKRISKENQLLLKRLRQLEHILFDEDCDTQVDSPTLSQDSQCLDSNESWSRGSEDDFNGNGWQTAASSRNRHGIKAVDSRVISPLGLFVTPDCKFRQKDSQGHASNGP